VSIIARYLLVEFLSASGVVFLALFVTYVAAYSVTHLDVLSDGSGGGTSEILFRSLEVIPVGVPIACLAGVVWSLTRTVRYREITAIRCGGIPLQRVLIPVLAVSVVIGAGLVVFEDRVIIPTRAALVESGDSEDYPGPDPSYMNGRWWYASGSSIFSAGAYLPDEKKLIDVTVFNLDRDRNIEQRIEADEAVNLAENSWEFHGAHIFEFGSGRAPRIREQSRLNLDLGLSGQDLKRAAPPAELTTLHKLARQIREHPYSDSTLIELQAAFHRRLAQPLSVLVLVLLALPFAIGDVERPDSLPRALLRALAASLLFWLAWGVGVFIAVGSWRFRRIME
jgi:lipopolysaccharide export system permease protein